MAVTKKQAGQILKAYRSAGSIRGAEKATGINFHACKKVIRESEPDARRKAAVSPTGTRDAPEPAASEATLQKLRKAPMAMGEVESSLGVDTDGAKKWMVDRLKGGLNLVEVNGKFSVEKTPVPVAFGQSVLEILSDDDDTFTLGALGDSHLCSKYQRLDVLNDLYDQYQREGVKDVFHTGNWIDGEARFNKFDLLVHGMDAQVRYLAEHYPKRPGLTTYAVAGDDHEGWYGQQTGVNIGRYAEMRMRDAGRSDWVDLGYMEAFVRLTNRNSGASSMLHVVHPGGGSSYALSYTVQKFVESYAGGEKPAVLFMGHYHKMEQVLVRGVFCVQTGCTQDQTPFMRKKKLEAHVGGHTIRLRQDRRTGAILEMNGQKRYFNVGYYNDRWSHSGGVVLPKRVLGGVV